MSRFFATLANCLLIELDNPQRHLASTEVPPPAVFGSSVVCQLEVFLHTTKFFASETSEGSGSSRRPQANHLGCERINSSRIDLTVAGMLRNQLAMTHCHFSSILRCRSSMHTESGGIAWALPLDLS